jgi:hypothetical protein
VLRNREPFVCEEPGLYRIGARVLIPDEMPEFRVDVEVDVQLGARVSRVGRRNVGAVGSTRDLPQQDGADVDLSAEPDERDVATEWTFGRG